MNRPWLIAVSALLAAGLILRVVMLVSGLEDPERLKAGDSFQYGRLADNLHAHGIHSLSESEPFIPDTLRPPGLPALWWALHAAGLHGDAPRTVLTWVLGFAVCLAAGLAAGCALGRRWGALCAAILLSDPLMAVYSVMHLTECLFALLIAAWFLSVIRLLQTHRLRWSAAAGLAWSLALMVKPIALVLLPVSLLAAALACRAPGRRALSALLMAAVMAPLPAAWVMRNHRATGVATLSSISAELFYFYHGAAVEARAESRPVEAVQREWGQRRSEIAPLSDGLRPHLDFMRGETRRAIGEHPVLWTRMMIEGFARIAVAPVRAHLRWILPSVPLSNALMALQFALVLALWLGLLVALRRWGSQSGELRLILALAAVSALLLMAAASGGNANARFRVPAMPLLAIAACIGAAQTRWGRGLLGDSAQAGAATSRGS